MKREGLDTIAEINSLVIEQMSIIACDDRREALQSLLVRPYQEERRWDYGTAEERYSYWVVAESVDRGIILVYCAHGFGPGMPWGFLYRAQATLGMDSQWNWYLEEAFVRSGLWPGGVCEGDAILLSPEERFNKL